MSYQEYVDLLCQPLFEQRKAHGELGELLATGDVPWYFFKVHDISAVLWDPEQQRDHDGHFAYTLMVDGEAFAVWHQKNAREFLCYLFDSYGEDRDWLARLPSMPRPPRVDFATKPQWRCRYRLPFGGTERCCVALVPANVVAVIGDRRGRHCGVQVRGSGVPLLLDLGDTCHRAFAQWLFDADQAYA